MTNQQYYLEFDEEQGKQEHKNVIKSKLQSGVGRNLRILRSIEGSKHGV
jgi:hypothetical protein